MFSLSTLLHLRIPFSFFLMPVYFFSLANSPNFTASRILWSFLIIHLLLYPASNGYNSYFDKDEKSIGGLKNPPPVKQGLYVAALLFDGLAILLGLKISLLFSLMLLIYGLASKAYSHPAVRLKKYPIIGWLVTGFFQGFFTFLMCYEGINAFGPNGFNKAEILIPAALTSIMLLGNYPMTQIYQHEEDEKHGDKTLSIMLGIKGTFIFTFLIFTLATIGFVMYFLSFFDSRYAILFITFLSPVLIYFLIWFLKARNNEKVVTYGRTMWLNFISFFDSRYAILFIAFLSPVLIYFLIWFFKARNSEKVVTYGRTMWLNFISAICLNGFFIYLFLDSTQVLQAIKAGY